MTTVNNSRATDQLRQEKQCRIEELRQEHDAITPRLEHGKQVIQAAWQDEARPLAELEALEDFWIALWRKQRHLAGEITALAKEIADIEGVD